LIINLAPIRYFLIKAKDQCTTKQDLLKKIPTPVLKIKIFSVSLGMLDLAVGEEGTKMSTRRTFSLFSKKCLEEVWVVGENEDADVTVIRLRIIHRI
jgi:hypothetical protein